MKNWKLFLFLLGIVGLIGLCAVKGADTYGAADSYGTADTYGKGSGPAVQRNPNGSKVWIVRGNSRIYFADITNAVAVATNGDIVRLGPGTNSVGVNHLRLPHGVSLYGEGPRLSVIVGDGGLITNGPVVNPGSDSVVSGVQIVCGNRSAFNQATFGCLSSATPCNQAFTNAIIQDCELLGDSDSIYISHTLRCVATFNRVWSRSSWDNFYVFETTSDSEYIANNCRIENIYTFDPYVRGVPGLSRCIVLMKGRARFFGCDITTKGATNAYGFYNSYLPQEEANTVDFVGCHWDIKGTNAYPVENAQAPIKTLNLVGCDLGFKQVFGGAAHSAKFPGTVDLPITNIVIPTTSGGRFSLDDNFDPYPIGFVRADGTFEWLQPSIFAAVNATNLTFPGNWKIYRANGLYSNSLFFTNIIGGKYVELATNGSMGINSPASSWAAINAPQILGGTSIECGGFLYGSSYLQAGTNFFAKGTLSPSNVKGGITGTNNGVLWTSNNTLFFIWTAGGTTTNIVKIAGP